MTVSKFVSCGAHTRQSTLRLRSIRWKRSAAGWSFNEAADRAAAQREITRLGGVIDLPFISTGHWHITWPKGAHHG